VANPFVHVELNTTDVKKAKDFYGKLFSWKLEDMPMGGGGSYTMINVGEGTGGGMMKHPMPGAPSAWLAYVLVDDVAASTKKAKSLGERSSRTSARCRRSDGSASSRIPPAPSSPSGSQ